MQLVSSLLLMFAALGVANGQSPASTVSVMAGLGNHHHPIRTRSAEAQKFFDQGLTLVYAFNHEEAARSFRRAAELDPQAAMPWWGVALAVGPNYNLDVDLDREKAAYDAIQKARALSINGPEVESAYVAAMARRYSNDPKPDLKRLATGYKDAMLDLTRAYPEDLDAATLYAESMMDLNPWQLWTADGKPAENTQEIVAVLESVLKRDPEHIGANHYYVHAMEASLHPERALPSAERLKTLAPAAGHLVHMPAHIYERVGYFGDAVSANEAGAAADRNYLRSTGEPGSMYGLMYYSHNLHFLAIAASMEGNYGKARAAADQLIANVSPAVKQVPMLESFLPVPALVMVRFGRWDEIARLPEPDASLTIDHALWNYARAAALAAQGKIEQAEAERNALAAAVSKQPADAMYGFNPAGKVLEIALEAADARIAAARGDRKSAVEHWRAAVSAQDTLAYDEPADWYYPVRESLGAALFQDARYAEAEKVFRADLERNPRNPRSLFGLRETLKSEGKTADAEWVSAQFESTWKDADVQLRMRDL